MLIAQKCYSGSGAKYNIIPGEAPFYSGFITHNLNEHKPFAGILDGGTCQRSVSCINSERAGKTLDKFIEQQAAVVLGKQVYQDFGRLPYLFKVLDVKYVVNPGTSCQQQQAEFAAENQKAPLGAADRYKDDNHKPELMFALSVLAVARI